MGRPTSLTPAVRDAIVAEVEKGATLEVAAECSGFHQATLYEWMQRGRAGEEPFAEFAESVTRARARCKADMLRAISTAVTPGEFGVDDWKARAWILERTDRAGFGVKVEVMQRVEGTFRDVIERLRAELDPATYQRVVEIMSRALAGSGAGEDSDDPVRPEREH